MPFHAGQHGDATHNGGTFCDVGWAGAGRGIKGRRETHGQKRRFSRTKGPSQDATLCYEPARDDFSTFWGVDQRAAHVSVITAIGTGASTDGARPGGLMKSWSRREAAR